jgi:hypothetical protein
MDGRPHPKNVVPAYYGHSTGRWEGDTLVVDTVGFGETFWLDRYGFPHTEKLHMVERITRTDSITMKYEVTIDDMGAYTAPWSSGFYLFWDPGQELFEYVCQENNFASTRPGIRGSYQSDCSLKYRQLQAVTLLHCINMGFALLTAMDKDVMLNAAPRSISRSRRTGADKFFVRTFSGFRKERPDREKTLPELRAIWLLL